MKKGILVLSALVFAIAMQSCKKITGEGPVVTEVRNVPAFSSITEDMDATVHFIPGNEYKVEIHAQKNILDNMETRVYGAELKLQFKPHFVIIHHDRIDVYVTAPAVTGFKVSGSGDIDIAQPYTPQDIDLDISGSGSITISNLQTGYLSARISGSGDITVNGGTIDREKLTISGSGGLNMLDVTARTAETHTSGSGTTKVNVQESLDVHISGSGNVLYRGNPAVTASISGSGKVMPW